MRYTRTVRSATTLAIGLSAVMFAAAAARAQVPGWQAFRDNDTDYVIRPDVSHRDGGQGFAGATIKANTTSPHGSAMLAQSIKATTLRGKRVRLSGYMKTIGVNEGTAVLFMRVDGEGVVLASDYMQSRPLMMTTDWSRQEVVLDVPENAIGVTFGFMLGGSGQAWLDDVALEIVDQSVAVTGHPGGLYPSASTRLAAQEVDRRRRDQEVAYRRAPDQPVNLSLRADGGEAAVAASRRGQ